MSAEVPKPESPRNPRRGRKAGRIATAVAVIGTSFGVGALVDRYVLPHAPATTPAQASNHEHSVRSRVGVHTQAGITPWNTECKVRNQLPDNGCIPIGIDDRVSIHPDSNAGSQWGASMSDVPGVTVKN